MSTSASRARTTFVAVRERRSGRCTDRGPARDVSVLVVRSLSALRLAGGGLATVLVVQGPSAEDHDHSGATRIVTPTATLDVGAPSATLVHQANEMVGMPPSDAHRTGGEVLVPVTLTNTSDRPITYAPQEFHLLVDGKAVEAGGEAAGAPARELRPLAAISLRLTFSDAALVPGGQRQYAPATQAPAAAQLEAVPEGAPGNAPSASTARSTEHAAGDHDHGAH